MSILAFCKAVVFIFAFLSCTVSTGIAQKVLLNEDFGTTTTFPTGWTPSSTDWTNNNVNNSNNYTDASGGSNAYFGSAQGTGTTLTRTLTYSNNLSTVGYSNISVLWGARYVTSSTYTITVVLSWSANNGVTWNNVPFTNVTAIPVTNTTWSLVNNGTRIALPSGAANISNLMLRFSATYSSSSANNTNTIYRIDDVTVAGCPTAAGTISYTGSPFCKSITTPQPVISSTVSGGTYSSTTGLTINATTGAITPSTSTAGTYTITYSITAGTCTAVSTSATIVIADVPTVSATPTETCVGGSTGTITVSATGGTSPYTYSLNAGTYQTSGSFTGLAAATYTVSAKTSAGCVTSTSVTVNRYPNATDDQNSTATDSWVGHMYYGTSFTDYIGHFTETENFNELFGGNTTCFNLTSSAGTRSIYTENMSAKMLMTSSKKGLYTVNLGADDASRLTIDGTLMYNNWTSGTYSLKSNVLTRLTGSSNLLYEYYENTGANQLAFQGLTLLLANNLTTNTTQTICLGNGTGQAISGDAFGTLPVGITLSGTGYQWSYSTTPGGTRTDLTGATLATYTPVTATAPFSTVGTYYLYRTATLTSLNNTGFTTYTAALFSNAATITIVAAPTATISYTGNPFCTTANSVAVTRTGSSGGTYSSTTGLSLDVTTGAITPGSSTAGTYTVTYTIAATLGCAAFTTTTSVTITSAPSASISYPATAYCSSIAAAQAVNRSGTSGGTYSSTTGLAISSSTGDVVPGNSTAGTYTVTYTVAASGGCAAFSTSTPLTITAAPNATISYGSPFCKSVTTAQPVILSGTTGGSYSSTTGLTINSAGAITPGSSTAGSYTVTYAIAAAGGCAAYSTSTSVTITAVPTASITYTGSPFCSDAGTATPTLTGNSTGSYSSTTGLSISSSGAVNLGTSTAGSYTVIYTIPASGGCSAVTATAPVVIKTAGIWTGAVSSDFSNGGNWQCGSIPLSTTAIVVPAGLSVYPVVNGSVAATDISIASGASLTITGTLQVAGTLTGSGKFIATAGTVEFTGTTAQTIPAGLLDSFRIKNLTISNAAGVTMADTIKLTGILKITAGQLNTIGRLVLKSTATSTAMVAAITSAAITPVNGKVIVERYVVGRRKYRLITSSVTTSTATTLTAGQENLSIWGAWQNSGNNTIPGIGTFITGGSSTDGFDPQTTNASLFTYDDVNRRFTGFTTANGKKTNYTPLKAGTPYYMFVYGDRINTISTNTPNATVLTAAGTLLTGDQAYTTTSSLPLSGVVGRFTFLGNPFASAINWATIPKTGLDNAYWGWDPNLSGTGGYVTVLTSGTVTLQAPYTGSTGLNQYIQPGQGFFVKTTTASPTLSIREQDKVTTFNANAFRNNGRTNNPGLLAVNLLYNSGSSRVLADGVLTTFDEGMAAAGEGTAVKIPNPISENIALQQNTDWLSILTRPLPRPGDTLRLNLWRLTRLQYTLQIFAEQLPAAGLQAYLYDRYLDTLHALSLTDTNAIVFDITPGIAASADTNRFRIVFRPGGTPLPVKFISVNAATAGKNVAVSWTVAEAPGIREYSIEKATDGVSFREAGKLLANGNTATAIYHWLDKEPAPGNAYYRIRAVEKDGQFVYSKTVLVKSAAPAFVIQLSPNPVTGNSVKLNCGEIAGGQYRIDIVNATGSRVFSKEFNHTGGSLNQVISFGKNLPAGAYYLTISNGNSQNHQSFVVQ